MTGPAQDVGRSTTTTPARPLLGPRERELRPPRLPVAECESLERRLVAVFRKAVFEPLVRELLVASEVGDVLRVDNARRGGDGLKERLQRGVVTYGDGVFVGRFNAQTSRELKELGATWDKKLQGWRIAEGRLPVEVRAAISASSRRFEERLKKIDERLQKILPEEISDKVRVADIFDATLWKTERDLEDMLRGISVLPQMTPERRERITEEWTTNMEKWIQTFAEDEIVRLRKAVQRNAFAGNRYGAMVATIQRQYGVTAAKARFLARQETNLLVSKYRETRYRDAGVKRYRWQCVAGTALHPVRPAHKALDGKIFSWDDPPITTEPGEQQRRNHPGEDFNCRCIARPIVRF